VKRLRLHTFEHWNAALFVDFAKLSFKVGNQSLDAALRVWVCRAPPGKGAVFKYLHFQFDTLVL
jgi:hypothetical protein